MVAMLGILGSMSAAVTGISGGFSALGQTVSAIWEGIKSAWNENVSKPIGEFLDSADAKWEGFKTSLGNAFDFSLPAIFTYDYYFGEGGVFNWDIDWDGIFTFTMPAGLTSAYWFGEDGVFTGWEMPWESWGDFSLPEWLTWDYYFGSSVFTGWEMPWSDWGDFTLPDYLTLDYWFGEGGVFEWDIDWDGIFYWAPSGPFRFDYWFGEGGVFDWSMPWEDWDFQWSDFLPDWSWDDVIPEGLGDLFSIDGDITQTIANGFSGTLDAFKILVNNKLINPVNSVMNYDLPLIGSLSSITGLGNIPLLAKGGIVNKPTLAMIGEDGPEAVVPLTQRNNPNGAGMGGTVNVTVNAGGITDRTDKRALAREIGNMIQQELARNMGGTTMKGRY